MTGRSTHECPAGPCTRQVDWDKLMCPAHWRMVPPELRAAVLETWRYGAGAGDPAYLTAREAAVDAVNTRLGQCAEFGNTTLFGAPDKTRPPRRQERNSPMGIDNTSERMKDPAEKLALLAESLVAGSPASFIEGQERTGQAQLVASELLPSDHGDDAPWLELGFTFGDPADGDPLFVHAILPEGWKKQATNHSMGSVIVDTLGRERVSIFYKAAFYDRKASMHIIGLPWYVRAHVEYDGPLVISDEWATRDAVIAAMREIAEEERDEAAKFRRFAGDAKGRDEQNRSRCAEIAAENEATAAKYDAAIAKLTEAGDD